MKSYLLRRNQTQPIGTCNCGSVFKNPENNSAGKIIDSLGLLGYQVGSARISPMHGNFIENVGGNASSEDVFNIIKYVQNVVHNEFSIKLITEVTIYA